MTRNQGYRYRIQVGPAAAGQSVLAFLAASYRHSTEDEWSSRLVAGEILVDGKVAKASLQLRPGMVLDWNRPGWTEESTPQSFKVLYEDAHLLAVEKPSGLPTLPGGGFYLNTLLSLVQRDFEGVRPLHRLGRGTSGIVLFARSSEAASRVCKGWPRVQKRYLALSSGIAQEREYEIRAAIGLIEHPGLGNVHAASELGKTARSIARRKVTREETTIFEVDLHTGRPHQIRIHLAYIGHPLVGDPMYGVGGTLTSKPGLPGDLGYLLHAASLSLEHPITNARLEIDCEPPAALRVEKWGVKSKSCRDS